MNFIFWKNESVTKVKEDTYQSKELYNVDNVDNVTEHLKKLETISRNRANRISDTLGYIETLTDEAQNNQISLINERDIWKATFDSIPSFIILLDTNYKITRVNKAFISYIGIHKKFIIGKDCKEILGKSFCKCIEYCPVKDNNMGCRKEFQNLEIEDGKHFTISYSPILDKNEKVSGHVILLYDVTERVELHKTMQIRDSIITAINKTTEKMVRDFKPTNGHRVQEMIVNIGEAAQVSRVYIFKNISNENNYIVSQSYEWVNKNIESQINNELLQNFDMSIDFSRWIKQLEVGNIVHGHVKDFPKSEQQILLDQNIKSILIVPVFIHNKYSGFIGFDECNKERLWAELEINALKMAANILSAWIERGKVEKSLRKVIQNSEQTVKKLGEYLIEEKYITNEQLNEALNKQKKDNIL